MVTFHVPTGVIYLMPLWYYVNTVCHNSHIIFSACADASHVSDVAVCWLFGDRIDHIEHAYSFYVLTIYYMLRCSPT